MTLRYYCALETITLTWGVLRKKKNPSCWTICTVRPSSSKKGHGVRRSSLRNLARQLGTQSSEDETAWASESSHSQVNPQGVQVNSNPRALLSVLLSELLGLKQAWICPLRAGINSHCNEDGPSATRRTAKALSLLGEKRHLAMTFWMMWALELQKGI